ncbi:hypothetical protein KBD61_00140 [Patescibacteria group bacterium]|nr:hypothetical protein [Patescibacteria group bacterium]MBP9709419.1 hypothetical protein [Patescibacteria group bacterium]
MVEKLFARLLPKNVSPATYGLGILQAKTYRILKAKTASYLKRFEITTVDWAILGTLFSCSDGMALSTLSEHLGVKSPLITRRTSILVKKHLIQRKVAQDDSRSRIVSLTLQGKKLVPVIEKGLRHDIKSLFAGCSARELISFIRVMAKVAEHLNEVDEQDED